MLNKSFTLIELIVVIAIVAVLAAIIAPHAFQAIEKAKSMRVVTDLKSIKSACLGFYSDTGQWPLSINGVDYTFIMLSIPSDFPPSPLSGSVHLPHPLLVNPGVTGWDGPYLEKPARSPLLYSGVNVGIPGNICPAYGHYYTRYEPSDGLWWPGWYNVFDLNKDGTNEITNAWSINLYPVPEIVRRGVNRALDGDNLAIDDKGNVKATSNCEILTYYGALR